MKTKILLSMIAVLGIALQPGMALPIKPDARKVKYDSRKMNFQPVMFVENNVEFMVFPDGTVDFQQLIYNDYRKMQYGRTASERFKIRSKSVDQVFYDKFGNIALVEGVPLEYDRLGRIRLIGNTTIEYNRGNGWVKRIGSLQVNYNSKGQIAHTRGFVNDYNRKLNYNAFDKSYNKRVATSYHKRDYTYKVSEANNSARKRR